MAIDLPGYQINEKVYESSRSMVYRGYQESDGLPVILKALRGPVPTPERVAWFRREFEVLHNLNLPRVIHAYALKIYRQEMVMVLEDFGGESLTRLKLAGRLKLSEFLKLAIAVTESLEQIHTQRLMHKNINPSNIVLNPDTGEVKIIDFGLSASLSHEKPVSPRSDILEGSLAYISPEQTGRMNRTTDYHTDFYSLGVTLYELLTGRLPFKGNDPLELVHSHIAREPVPPSKLMSELPVQVSDILMKLMAKNAEDRYHSAPGLRWDLAECLRRWEASGNQEIESFPLGLHDVSDRFHIPQKLYGRDEADAQLLNAFERVAGGSRELLLVFGGAGVGKSTLVNEIHKPIASRNGFFISGKYNQFQRNTPYAAILQALNSLINQFLGESGQRLDSWREAIKQAVKNNGQVLVDFIPALGLILGEQPTVPDLGPEENQNRFAYIFQRFINTIANERHPLVLFVDDLQWADAASWNLLQVLLASEESSHILVIGAYRDTDLEAGNVLPVKLAELEKENVVITRLEVGNLAKPDVGALIVDSLQTTWEKARPLIDLVYLKTEGNAFFVTQFLHSLYEDGLLSFDYNRACWFWDVSQIKSRKIADNVLALVGQKINRLKPETRESLKLAACIGNKIDLQTLAIISEQNLSKTLENLWDAIEEGLIVPLDERYKLIRFASNGDGKADERPNFKCQFKFLHDRVQQTAYAMIPPEEQRQIHMKVGSLLLRNTPASEIEKKIFDIANQMNQGLQLIEDEETRLKMLAMNLMASQKAKNAIAYKPALEYIRAAESLLTEQDWRDNYDICVQIMEQCASCEQLNGDLDEADHFLDRLLDNINTDFERAQVYGLKLQYYLIAGKNLQNLDNEIKALHFLSVDFPRENWRDEILIIHQRIQDLIHGRSIESLIDLPLLHDPRDSLVGDLLTHIFLKGYFTGDSDLALLGILKLVDFSLKRQGHFKTSLTAYGFYGSLYLIAELRDYEQAKAFASLALKVLERFDDPRILPITYNAPGAFVFPWIEPLDECIKINRRAYEVGLEVGAYTFANFGVIHTICQMYLVGEQLDNFHEQAQGMIQFSRKTKDLYSYYITLCVQGAGVNLSGRARDAYSISDGSFDEDELVRYAREHNLMPVIAAYEIAKLQIYFTHEAYSKAIEIGGMTEAKSAVIDLYWIFEAYFYHLLSLTALYHSAEQEEQREYDRLIKDYRLKIKSHADVCPVNFLIKHLLAEAETARIQRKDEEAIDYYGKAISRAEEQNILPLLALAHELAAKFWLDRGQERYAGLHMIDAHYNYTLWGAKQKLDDLEVKYPHLLRKVPEALSSPETKKLFSLPSNDDKTASGILDLTTAIKAAQALSSEIVLERLLEKMMGLVAKNAGAQRGFLILKKGKGWFIEAEVSTLKDEIHTLQSIPLDENDDIAFSVNLSIEIIHFVIRSKVDVVLQDAAREGSFTQTPYILSQRPKSILCTPLVHQGKLTGVLYLENNLVTGAFTPDRLEILNLLSAQITISIENARLYDTLEQKVQERTRELSETLRDLKATQTQLIESEKLAALGSLVAGIAHEINTPVGIGITAASMLESETKTLDKAYDEGKLKESTLKTYIANAKQCCQFILKNLMRAGELVQSFKQVAVDQASLDLRPFKVKHYIESVLLSLKPKLRRTKHQVIINGNDKITINSYPGAVSQVITNLVMNSIKHAFEPEEKGHINFLVTRVDDKMLLEYSDDGKGIPEENLGRIFDPFFTTARSQGGSGLGLHIVYNLVTQKLKGTIRCDSVVGSHTRFTIELPMEIRRDTAEAEVGAP